MKLNCVASCHLIGGEYDMIVRIRGENMNKISELIFTKIRLIPGIVRTNTMVILKTLDESGDVPL